VVPEPSARAKKSKANREYKQHRRETDPAFVQREKAARRRHAKRRYHLSKLTRAFARAFPEQFEQFRQAVVPSTAFGLGLCHTPADKPIAPPKPVTSDTPVMDMPVKDNFVLGRDGQLPQASMRQIIKPTDKPDVAQVLGLW